MLRVRDDILLGLVIGGAEFPLDVTGFKGMRIIHTIDTFVPVVEVVVPDTLNFFVNKVTLADGLPMEIHLGVSEKDLQVMKFRVHKFSEQQENGATFYTIVGYFDVPRFYLATGNKPFTGTSSSVMSQLASASGMEFDGHGSSDTQVWLPRNDRFCVFAQNVMMHAWASDSSLFKLAITPTNVMRYKDVFRFDPGAKMPAFVNTDGKVDKGMFQMRDHTNLTRSGNNNMQGGGYGHRLVTQLVANEYQKTKDKVKYRRFMPLLEVSREVRGIVQGAPGSPGVQHTQFAPINCGNVHDRYWEAEYQNKRLARLFSQGARLLVEARTGIEALEPVRYLPHYLPAVSEADIKEQSQGVYVVTAKAINIQMNNYFESFELFTTGTAADPARTEDQE